MERDVSKLSRSVFENRYLSERIQTESFQNVIKGLKNGKNECFNYESDTLIINLKKGDTLPSHFSSVPLHDGIKIFFSAKVDCSISSVLNEKDPFNSLEFNIYAIAITNDSSKVYSLHFDRHIQPQKNQRDSIEPHPIYHFQFGGNKLQQKVENTGDTFFFDAPRIMHHPMEFILGLDFVLSNFLPATWRELQKDSSYSKIMKKYQKHFVYPYFKSIYNHFDNTSQNENWSPQNIYPQLVYSDG